MKKPLWIVLLLALICTLALSACDDTNQPQTPNEDHVHAFGEWTTVKDATCTVKGEQERICSCGEKETKSIDATGHTEVIDVAVAATCTTDGKTEGKHCSVCNETIIAQNTIPASHTDGEWVTDTNATCTVDGSKHQVCSVCTATIKTEPIAATGHTDGEWITDTNATCTVDGSKHQVCSVCSASIKTGTIAATGHTESSFVIDVPATIYAEGLQHTYCTICDEDVQTNVPVSRITSMGLAYEVNADGTTCTITGIGTCTDTEIGIPDTIDGYKVTAIGENAFENRSSVTAIALSSNIRTIERRAFYGCTGLTDFTIPSSIQSIGVQVFYKCNNLSTVYYNSTFSPAQDEGFLNTSSIKKVVFNGSYVPANICYGCSALTDIEILNNVKSIRGYAFANCSNLINVYFDIETLTMNVWDDRYQFENCTSLETIVLPEGLTDISNYAFEGCSKLKNITIPASVVFIEDRPFWSCYSIENIYISSIEAYCKIRYEFEDQAMSHPMYYAEHIYLNGELITELVIPDTVTKIPRYAFNSVDIKKVVISDSVISIGDHAFNNCEDAIIIIPDSVSYIGNGAFGNYNGNLTIYCVAESQPAGWDANWTNEHNTIVWGYTE